jgi:hypothetical protein
MLARFAGGWGVLGGMVVEPGAGVVWRPLNSQSPAHTGPRIFAGTTIELSPGVAIDAAGNVITVCSPVTIDLLALEAQNPVAAAEKTCAEWFNITGTRPCEEYGVTGSITAREYWLVAEYNERLARPAPKYSGSGPCDPAPTCDFSRSIEDFTLRVVSSLPDFYPVTGCLDNVGDNLLTDLPNGASIVQLSSFLNGTLAIGTPDGTPTARYAKTIEAMDCINKTATEVAARQPVVVLARLLLTSNPGGLSRDLPTVPTYVIVQAGHPARRAAQSAAFTSHMIALLMARNPSLLEPSRTGQSVVLAVDSSAKAVEAKTITTESGKVPALGFLGQDAAPRQPAIPLNGTPDEKVNAVIAALVKFGILWG